MCVLLVNVFLDFSTFTYIFTYYLRQCFGYGTVFLSVFVGSTTLFSAASNSGNSTWSCPLRVRQTSLSHTAIPQLSRAVLGEFRLLFVNALSKTGPIIWNRQRIAIVNIQVIRLEAVLISGTVTAITVLVVRIFVQRLCPSVSSDTSLYIIIYVPFILHPVPVPICTYEPEVVDHVINRFPVVIEKNGKLSKPEGIGTGSWHWGCYSPSSNVDPKSLLGSLLGTNSSEIVDHVTRSGITFPVQRRHFAATLFAAVTFIVTDSELPVLPDLGLGQISRLPASRQTRVVQKVPTRRCDRHFRLTDRSLTQSRKLSVLCRFSHI